MAKLLENISDLIDLVIEGRALEAFEKYYHKDVVMQENESEPTFGKDANRKREIAFFDSIVDFRSAKPLKVTVGENITMVQWYYDYTHKEWGVKKYKQVSIQEWKDGQIIREQFIYNN